MEMAIEAIGNAIAAWATAFGCVYVVGIIAKTFLLYTEKIKPEETKDWFQFWRGKRGL